MITETTKVSLQAAIPMYAETLDMDGTVNIAGYEFTQSVALYKLDPIAYRVGFYDFLAAMDLELEDSGYTEWYFSSIAINVGCDQ